MCMCSESLSYYLHFFFFNDTATTEIYTLSLHDALPILRSAPSGLRDRVDLLDRGSCWYGSCWQLTLHSLTRPRQCQAQRSEEHTSELQSRQYLVCRLLLEKKKKKETKLII